jgi:hypothetical protein
MVHDVDVPQHEQFAKWQPSSLKFVLCQTGQRRRALQFQPTSWQLSTATHLPSAPKPGRTWSAYVTPHTTMRGLCCKQV